MTKAYQPHELRVLAERDELQEKYDKLGKFLLSNPTMEDVQAKFLLNLQHQAMGSYLYILNERIKRFQGLPMYNGIALIRATVLDSKATDITVNLVPPQGMDITEIDTKQLYDELLYGVDHIIKENNPINGQELMFFIEYTKEAAPL